MAELSREDLIAKLQNISGLYKATRSIQAKMDDFEPEDNYPREISVPEFPGNFSKEEQTIWVERLDHTAEFAAKVAEGGHRKAHAPEEPKKPVIKEFQKIHDTKLADAQSKFGCLSYVAAGVCGFFLLGSVVGGADSSTLPTILGIAAIGGVAFFLFRKKVAAAKAEEEKKNAQALAEHNRRSEEIMAEYKKKKEIYDKDLAEYEIELKQFMEEYLAWREIYLQSVDEEAEIADKLEADRVAAVNAMYQQEYLPAEAALNEANTLVSEDYLPVLPVIIDLLRSSRADNLKEAINLYEDLVYRERQLQLQREIEEQRQYEEELKREAEERHHQEQMRFKENQERQRRQEEAQRRSDEERHHQEQMKLQQDQEQQRRREEEKRRKDEARRQREYEDQQRSAASAQCRACANVAHCNMRIHNKTPNCTGFRPR